VRDLPPPTGAVVGGFWPVGTEIDILPLLATLRSAGHLIALPVTPSRGNPLIFRLWQPGDTLMPEGFGTQCPPDTAPNVEPDWLFVPLLAFDAQGNRLGYGGGFYDRTLAERPNAVAVGCAYAAQRVDAVPTGPYDARLDAVATERGVIQFTERG